MGRLLAEQDLGIREAAVGPRRRDRRVPRPSRSAPTRRSATSRTARSASGRDRARRASPRRPRRSAYSLPPSAAWPSSTSESPWFRRSTTRTPNPALCSIAGGEEGDGVSPAAVDPVREHDRRGGRAVGSRRVRAPDREGCPSGREGDVLVVGEVVVPGVDRQRPSRVRGQEVARRLPGELPRPAAARDLEGLPPEDTGADIDRGHGGAGQEGQREEDPKR